MKNSPAHTVRIRIIFGVFACICLALVGKLYLVQVAHGEAYADKADRQYTQPQGGLFDRGTIYFNDKEGERIAAATIASGFLLAINPSVLEYPTAAYEKLSSIIPLDKADFLARAKHTEDPYEEVAHHLNQQEADAIKALDIDGIRVYKQHWRLYPGGTLASHVLGFVGSDGTTESGQYGLERYYERTLARHSDSMYVNFFAEVFSGVGDILDAAEGEGEGDLVTTIEPTVQATLEEGLAHVKGRWDVKSAGGIIMDPVTGDIYALAAIPAFDPNDFREERSAAVFANPLVEHVFEMGSIMKPLTVAAGLDAGVIAPTTTYNDLGYVKTDGYTIYNYDKKGRGIVDMYRVLGNSLNTGVAFIVGKLGNARFGRYMKAYGLGTETGIDLPGEVSGLIDNLDSPRDVEYITASFGQGIAVTPIAMTRALASLGNGGLLVTPHVTKSVDYSAGVTKDVVHAPSVRVLKEGTSETITKILVRVVDEYLAGGTKKLKDYSIAAKTGTAQIANPSAGGYYSDRYLHSFFGYFPAYNPRFIIFLYAEEPKGVNFASETLTEPFMDLAGFLISYYNLPPDR
jgi:stage V sporulation protein D (sporulation-specific penicillin-binding protein)